VPLNDLSTGADSVVTNHSIPHSQTCADSVVTNHSIPHSQTWALSKEANKRSGMCSVCFATRQIHVKDSTIHKHGPRNNPCTGSDQLPVTDSVQPQQSRQPLQSNTTACWPSLVSQTVNSVDHHTATEPIMQHGGIRHPIQDKPILKRIPKSARPAVSNSLIKLIQNVLSSPSTEASWTKLLTACLAKPNRGGKSRYFTTNIIKQIRLYNTQDEPSSMSQNRVPILSSTTD